MLSVKNVKKNTEAPGAPPARPTGLFIDPDTRASATSRAESVIDVEARTVPDVSAEEGGVPPASGFAGIRVKRSAAAKEDAPAEPDSAKAKGLGSLRARFAGKPPVPAIPEVPVAADQAPAKAKGFGALRARFGSKQDAPKQDPQLEETVDAGAEFSPPPIPKAEKPEKTVKAEKAKKAEKEPKAPKAAKPKKAPRASGKTAQRASLLVELDTGRQLYWALDGARLAQLTEAPGTALFSVSKEDSRFATERPLSHKQATDVAMQEMAEAVQVVNRSRELGSIYATSQERALESKVPLLPTQQLLDVLLAGKDTQGKSVICGFHLTDAESDSSLAVLYHLGKEGESSKPQISVNPDSMEFVIAQFIASRKLDKNGTELHLFDNAAFLSVAADASAYPNERVWHGIPVRKVFWGVAMASMVLAAGSIGWAGYQMQQAASLKSQEAAVKANIAKVQQNVGNQIRESLPDFVNAMSLDVTALATRAQEMWVPDSRMMLTADLSSAKYEIWLPVTKGDSFYNRPSAIDSITADTHQILVNFKAPEGCTRDAFGVSGSMNETELTINCETGNPALARYRND